MDAVCGQPHSWSNEDDGDTPLQTDRKNKREQSHATITCPDSEGSRQVFAKEKDGQGGQFP